MNIILDYFSNRLDRLPIKIEAMALDLVLCHFNFIIPITNLIPFIILVGQPVEFIVCLVIPIPLHC